VEFLKSFPDRLHLPLDIFAESFHRRVADGAKVLEDSSVCVIGLARNCEGHLRKNLARVEEIGRLCREWWLHVETNDNTDGTDQVLADFTAGHRQATFRGQRLGRKQYSAEFAGPRTQAFAEYRTACQRWVRESAAGADIVVVVDFDAWGGWSHAGFLHGLGTLYSTPDAFGVAGVSMMQHPAMVVAGDGVPAVSLSWLHYDAWALRLNSYWDDYTAGEGSWKHSWLPPVGSPPIPVCSAFGGMAAYRTQDYLAGTYSGEDCEHVLFHRTIAARTGRRLYLDPAMRTVMHWVTDGRQHSDD
jgi:hypothetical protein